MQLGVASSVNIISHYMVLGRENEGSGSIRVVVVIPIAKRRYEAVLEF